MKAQPYGESQHSTVLLDRYVSLQPHIKNVNALISDLDDGKLDNGVRPFLEPNRNIDPNI